MTSNRVPLRLVLATVVLCAFSSAARAATKCSAKTNGKTGAIEVSGSGFAAPPHWGAIPGPTDLDFTDAASCVTGGKLSKCHLGAPGTLAEATPPEACTIYVGDGIGPACAARLKGCTPGLRLRDASIAQPRDPRGVIGAAAVRGLKQADINNLNFSNVDFSDANLVGTGMTNAYFRGANFFSADLSGAFLGFSDLTGASMVTANLTGADCLFTDFTSVLWSFTICPDGTSSATNGTNPESCCGHVGATAICTP